MSLTVYFQRLSIYLERPHHWENKPIALFKQAFWHGAVAFAVMWFFKPFGFHRLDSEDLLQLCLEISGAAMLLVFICYLLIPFLFPKFHPADQWTIRHEILLSLCVVLLIGIIVGILLFSHGFLKEISPLNGLLILVNTVLVSLIPITIFTILDHNKLLRHNLHNAESYSASLKHSSPAPERLLIALSDDKGKPILQLPSDSILFLQAAGNYAEVHFLNQEGQPQRELLRNRLKALQEILPEQEFIQSHRSYLVNRQHIRKVKGNARNYELILEGTSLTVPVARSKAESVMAALAKN